MTREKTTKAKIRARMAKTGERYTTARRHALGEAASPERDHPEPVAPAVVEPTKSTSALDPRGAASDARVLERTGRDLRQWFAVLDAFDATKKGHTAAARHLRDDHEVDAWYSQGITVAYERARGLRTMHERAGGTFEFNVSKVLYATPASIAEAIEGGSSGAAWKKGLDPAVAAAIRSVGAMTKKSTGARRLRALCGAEGEVELVINPQTKEKSQLVVTHRKLSSRELVERHRAAWRAAVATLAELLAR